MGAGYLGRLHGWRFVLFNAVLGLSHIVVLFNAGSYIALLPSCFRGSGRVLPSFHLGANRLHGRIGVGLSTRAVPVRTDWRLPSSDCAFIVYSIASHLCGDSRTLRNSFLRASQALPGGITLPIAQSMLLNEYPKRLKAVALTVQSVQYHPFTIGMPVGGYIAYMLGWRFLFTWISC